MPPTMLNITSTARIRQIFTLICLSIIFILSLIIMGLVGVHGKTTVQSVNNACLLYMTVNGDVVSYNNSYCLFPIVGAAVLAFLSLCFIAYWVIVVHRNDEFAPRVISVLFLFMAPLCAMLAFAITGEIGIGLNRGCRQLGAQINQCRKTKPFNALWGAEICAGMIGGLWLIAMLLEMFQFMGHPGHLPASTVDHINTTTVVPYRAGDVDHGNLHNNNTTTTVTGGSPYQQGAGAYDSTKATPVQKAEFTEPQTSQYPAYGQQQAQQQLYQQQQPYVPPPHPADANGVSFGGYQS